jgi:hypothetical protein
MSFISISIDICGSTEAKARLRDHSSLAGRDTTDFYESFQRQVLHVEETFWTMLRSSHLDMQKLFLIKSIGDEIWYAYDLEGLHEYEIHAAIVRMIEALVNLQTKPFDLVAGPLEDPSDWKNADPNTLLRIEIPLKITIDLIKEALDVGIVREKFLAPHVVSLLSPLGKATKPVLAGDPAYINLCNRLGIANQVSAGGKVHSSVRTDYIGWEIDRFFRLTKAAIKGTVLIGPEITSIFDSHSLIISNNTERQSQDGKWTVSMPRIKIPCGSGSYTSLNETYVLARRHVSAKELKGIGSGCMIGIVFYKYQENVDLDIFK